MERTSGERGRAEGMKAFERQAQCLGAEAAPTPRPCGPCGQPERLVTEQKSWVLTSGVAVEWL